MVGVSLWLGLQRGLDEVGHVAGVVARAVATSPDGAPAIGLSLLLVVAVAIFAAHTLSPGPGRWACADPCRAEPASHTAPGGREIYSPPPPKGFPVRAYRAAESFLLLGTAPSPARSLLDETGLVPMAYSLNSPGTHLR